MKSQTNTGYVAFLSLVAAIGGILFGYDTAVISGTISGVAAQFSLDAMQQGWFVGCALVGSIGGVAVAGVLSDRFGRKLTMLLSAVLFTVSAVGCAVSADFTQLVVYRIVGGVGIGVVSIVSPMYISEVAVARWRGTLVSLYQLAITVGFLAAYLVNFQILKSAETAVYASPWMQKIWVTELWRGMFGAETLPALLFFTVIFFIPESPRWLLIRSRDAEARRVLERTTRENVEAEMAEIRASLAGAGDTGERLFRKKYFIPILLAFLISTFNQLTGINAILYYAPRLFEMSGVFREGAMMQSIVIGITNLTFTMLGMFLIDKVGRKKLIGVGAVGMFVSLVLVARGFWLERFEGYYMLVCLMGYIAFFAVSLGATIWVVISEVFPNSVRAKGQVLGSMTHWVWSALLSWFFPVFLSVGGTYIFGFFALIALGSLIFAIKLPETKDKSLEQIQKELVK
jgi:SP family arabinose:H+ symporter-like MFS transporter